MSSVKAKQPNQNHMPENHKPQNHKPMVQPRPMTVQQQVLQQKESAKIKVHNSSQVSPGGKIGDGSSAKSPVAQPQTSKPRPAPEAGGLEFLMSMEGRIRETKNENELIYFAVNETRKLTGARQIFLFQRLSGGEFKPKAVSSMALTDPDSPMLRWMTKIVKRLGVDANITEAIEFRLPAYADEADEETKTYPFKHFLWQPLALPNGHVFGGFLQARESSWPQSAATVTGRLASVYAHTWAVHVGPRRLSRAPVMKGWMWPAAIATLLLAMLIPVPMTVLAPVEVVAETPFVVAAPIDGIISEVIVAPNTKVRAGDVLFKFNDTALRNKKKLAERELSVAKAGLQQSVRGAFSDPKARHQLAIAKAEVELKRADFQYASEVLAQVTVRAPTDGIVISPDKDHWKGRPVSTGEKIMKIADPKKVALRVDLPVADAIVLNENARVRVFLDAHPLSAVDAQVVRTSYQGKPTPTKELAYDVRAKFTESNFAPRIGARGTAQIYGEDVPLGFYLFRRPIAAVRQYLGF